MTKLCRVQSREREREPKLNGFDAIGSEWPVMQA
jgi:hypothetical protein